jgi:hypothetical protein
MELLEPGDLEALVAEILERASVGADVTWDDGRRQVFRSSRHGRNECT